MQENRVDLDDERQSAVGNELSTSDCQGVAEDNHKVMDKELICAAFSMIEKHIECIVEKVSNGETDESVT